MKRVITVGGPHGSGKSSIADRLAEEFDLRRTSAGIIFRRLARERGLSLEEFSRLAEQDKSIDRLLDDRLREEARRGNVVIDGQLAASMAGEYADLKVYLTAPLEVRVQRIASRDGRDYDAALQETMIREESERRRYRDYYGIDVDDLSIYDLVLNTEHYSLDEVYEIVSTAVRLRLQNDRF